MSEKPVNNLSYSKISTFESCSWLYSSIYRWKVPGADVEGNIIGNITHECIEHLGHKKRVDYTKKILAARRLPVSITRLVTHRLKQEGYYSAKNVKDICTYIGRFVMYDFFFAGSVEILPPEFRFSLKQDKYNLNGFIDRAAIYNSPEGRYVVIRDAKTQKTNFTEEEMEYSKQALCYLLAVKRLFPDINIEKSRVEFVMLKFPEDFVKTVEGVDDAALSGFESILADYQEKVDDFTDEDAVTKFEAARGWLKPGQGFGGLTKCGAKVKDPNERKADGTLKWRCAYKFPKDYYVLQDSDGKVLTSADTAAELKPKEGQKVVLMRYKGCFYFNKENYS